MHVSFARLIKVVIRLQAESSTETEEHVIDVLPLDSAFVQFVVDDFGCKEKRTQCRIINLL